MESSFVGAVSQDKAPAHKTGEPPERPLCRMSRSAWVWLAVVLIAALGARLGLYFAGPAEDPRRTLEPDSQRYLELASNLVQHGRLVKGPERTGIVHVPLERMRAARKELPEVDDAGLRPEVLRTPGYPLLLAAALKMGMSVRSVLILQIAISVLGVLFVFLLGRRLLESNAAALVAAAVVALNPADMLAANTLLAETLFTCVLLIGLWLIVVGRKRGWVAATVGALIVGFSALVRPIAIFIGPLAAVWLLVTGRNRRTLAVCAVVAVVSMLPAGAWMFRNQQAGHGFHISSVPYINGLFYTCAYMQIREDDGDTEQDWPAAVTTLFSQLHDRIDEEQSTFAGMRQLTIEKISEKPALYAAVLGRSATKFMLDHSMRSFCDRMGVDYEPTGLGSEVLEGGFDQMGEMLSGSSAAPLAWMSWNGVMAVAMVVGAWFLIMRRRFATLLLFLGVFGYFLAATQANGLERFRVPVLGIQALLIGGVLVQRRVEAEQASKKDGARESRGANALTLPIPPPSEESPRTSIPGLTTPLPDVEANETAKAPRVRRFV